MTVNWYKMSDDDLAENLAATGVLLLAAGIDPGMLHEAARRIHDRAETIQLLAGDMADNVKQLTEEIRNERARNAAGGSQANDCDTESHHQTEGGQESGTAADH